MTLMTSPEWTNSNPNLPSSSTATTSKSNIRRRSYADWISRAIQSTSDSKMTLAGIYHWMATNVPGLYEKRNLHSSKGWKNAVRHTLSVNRRFKKSTQPNRRAALWSLASDDESSSTPNPDQPSSSGITSQSPSTSFLAVNVTSIYSLSRSSPCSSGSSTSFLHSATVLSPTLPLPPESIETQTLELHQQDGTVRTVTVPKPVPIHVVGEYRLVPIDPTPLIPSSVTTSGSG